MVMFQNRYRSSGKNSESMHASLARHQRLESTDRKVLMLLVIGKLKVREFFVDFEME